MTATYHSALGLREGATATEIKIAYRRIAAEMHPDHTRDDGTKLALINAAYTVLKADPHYYFGRRSDLAWARDYEAAFKPQQPKAEHKHAKGDRCGAATKSGPCVRPFGHTANGHMSAEVLKQKNENLKARKAAQKAA